MLAFHFQMKANNNINRVSTSIYQVDKSIDTVNIESIEWMTQKRRCHLRQLSWWFGPLAGSAWNIIAF